ncbi:MAG: hypothetical protein ACPGOY_09205 [Rhodospirillaceae bacterium]
MPTPKSLEDLLRYPVAHDGWERDIANIHKVFYLRGFSTFELEVLRNQSIVSNNKTTWYIYINEMIELIGSRKQWIDSNLLSKVDEYSIRQAQDGLSKQRKPLLFGKAVQTLVLLEVMAKHIFDATGDSRDPSIVYEKMNIEAAISYIPGFERSSFDIALNRNQDLLQHLLNQTGQTNPTVFYHMADRKAVVTHKLALKVHETLNKEPTSLKLNKPDFKFNTQYKYRASKDEDINAAIDPALPVPTSEIPATPVAGNTALSPEIQSQSVAEKDKTSEVNPNKQDDQN